MKTQLTSLQGAFKESAMSSAELAFRDVKLLLLPISSPK